MTDNETINLLTVQIKSYSLLIKGMNNNGVECQYCNHYIDYVCKCRRLIKEIKNDYTTLKLAA